MSAPDPHQLDARDESSQWPIFVAFTCFGMALYFVWDRDYVLASLLGLIGSSSLTGYRFGAISILVSGLAMAAAFRYAPSIGIPFESLFASVFGTAGLTNRCLTVSLTGVLIACGVTHFVARNTNKFFRRRPAMDTWNRWLGLAVGGVEGVAILAFVLGGFLVLEPLEQRRPGNASANTTGKFISTAILTSVDYTRKSRIGPVVEKYNPFVVFPSLNKLEDVQHSVAVLSDPARVQRLLKHPSIQKLQQRPDVRAALSNVQNSTEIKQILESGKPMDVTTALTLLSDPSVLELVDQPGFLEEAMKVIRGSEVGGSRRNRAIANE